MTMDVEKACTACQNCGQSSNWTHDDGGCPYCSKPRGSPTIAAPAAHIERRKGQRWRLAPIKTEKGVRGFDFTLGPRKSHDEWKIADCTWAEWHRSAFDYWWTNAEKSGHTMTLLADAPPEPEECWCGGPLTGETLCSTHAAEAAKCESPPAQEAPKAAPVPVCDKCRCSKKDVCDFRFDGRGLSWCGKCRGVLLSWMAEQAGKPYAGPERLPKPQLAADWVEDCLPESGR